MRMHLPTVTALQTFEAVARLGSFVNAADERHVSPSAISHQMADLESVLSVRLFVRTQKGVALTGSGEFYLQYVRDVIESLSAATLAVRGHERPSVTVRLYVTSAPRLLMPILGEFRELHPDILLKIKLPTRTNEYMLERSEVSILYGRPDGTDAEIHRLARGALIPYCSRAYLKTAPALEHPRDITKHTVIRNAEWHDDWELWLAISERTPSLIPDGLVLPNREIAVLGAEMDQGVVLAPRFIANSARDDMVVPLAIQLPTPDIYLMIPRKIVADDSVRIFCDWLRNKLGQSLQS